MTHQISTPQAEENDIRDHEINRLQRAMAHMLAAHQAASVVGNNMRHHSRELKRSLDAALVDVAEREAKVAALEAKVVAAWKVAIRTAANVAEFNCGAPAVALAISVMEHESVDSIDEMLAAAQGQ